MTFDPALLLHLVFVKVKVTHVSGESVVSLSLRQPIGQRLNHPDTALQPLHTHIRNTHTWWLQVCILVQLCCDETQQEVHTL